MRIILSIIALFSLCGTLRAQPYTPSRGGELPNNRSLSFPSQAEAAAALGGDTRYHTRIKEWTRSGNTFTAPITVPFAWANRQVLLFVQWASADYEVRINGKAVAHNANANAPAEFNITKQVNEGRNTVEIVIVSTSASTSAPLESWRETRDPALGVAWLQSQPTLRIRDLLIKVWQSDERDGTLTAEIGIVVKTHSLNPRSSRFHYELAAPSGELTAAGYKEITLDMLREDTLRFITRIPAHLQWSTDFPTLYTLRLKTQHEGRYAEFMEYKVGFRALEMRDGEMLVNGVPVKLRIHEVPPTVDENDVAQLQEKGYNTIKLLPGITPQSLYEICDRLGVYVIAQAPIDTRRSGMSRTKGANPSNDPAWLSAYLERVNDSYHTAKRHPSVVAFAFATQSSNGINLYESYLDLKRHGDARPFIYPEAAGEWNSDHLKWE